MKSFQYEQLDADTKAYLRFVRDGRGRGSPGVFIPFKSSKPIWAIIVGPLVFLLFLGIGYTSTKAGWAVAMLQTAGVMLGGWLIVFAIRRWTVNPDKFAGHFVYFDPDHAFYGLGEEIQVAKLGREPDVEPRGENLVRFDTSSGAFVVPVPSRVLGQYVTDYYDAVKWVRNRTDGPWAGANSAEAGGVARFLVEEDREPTTLADTGLEVDDIPSELTTARGPSSGLVRYLILLGIGAGVFALFAFTNPAVLDDMAFDRAKEAVAEEKARNANPAEKSINKGFTGAFAVRDYLLNDKHTRHRKEAEELLSGLYTEPINRLRSGLAALPQKDRDVRNELVELLEILRKEPTPAVSFRISLETVDGDGQKKRTEIAGERGKQVRSLFADGFGAAIGKDLVLGTVPGETVKANIEVAYTQDPRNRSVFAWTVEVRSKYTQAKVFDTTGVVNVGQQFGGFGVTGGVGNPAFPPKQQFGFGEDAWSVDEPLKDVLGEDDAVYQAVMAKLVGFAPARPMAD